MTTLAELARESQSDSAKAALEQARELMQSLKPDKTGVARKPTRSERIKSFLNSWPWKKLRYRILRERGRVCECCKATAADGAKICVDHIKPVRHYWHLRLAASNLQVLCDGCNRGKGSHDMTDFRVTVAAK
jgi:5-methylcytosine-specific restriction endonuclease McrA